MPVFEMPLQEGQNCPKDMDNIIGIVLKQGSDDGSFPPERRPENDVWE